MTRSHVALILGLSICCVRHATALEAAYTTSSAATLSSQQQQVAPEPSRMQYQYEFADITLSTLLPEAREAARAVEAAKAKQRSLLSDVFFGFEVGMASALACMTLAAVLGFVAVQLRRRTVATRTASAAEALEPSLPLLSGNESRRSSMLDMDDATLGKRSCSKHNLLLAAAMNRMASK